MPMNQQQRATSTVLPLKAALYHAVHDQRGGVGAVAGAYGFNVNTLQHKLNLNNEGRHVLTATEFEAILAFTRDPRIMDSLCAVYGDAAWFDLGGITQAGDDSLFLQVGELVQTVGSTAKHVAEALADGRISAAELAQLEADAMRMHAHVQALIAAARARMEGGA